MPNTHANYRFSSVRDNYMFVEHSHIQINQNSVQRYEKKMIYAIGGHIFLQKIAQIA